MKTVLAFLALLFTASLSAQSVKLGFDTKGVTLDAGANGELSFAAPNLTGTDKKPRKPVFAVAADGKTATATYADGFVITIEPSSADGTIRYSFDHKPENATAIVITSTLPLSYNNAGTFTTNGGPAQPFPLESGKQLFAQGAFTQVNFYTGTGAGLSFTTPASYQQLQDPRAWGVQAFQWIYHYDLSRFPNATSFTLKVTPVSAK